MSKRKLDEFYHYKNSSAKLPRKSPNLTIDSVPTELMICILSLVYPRGNQYKFYNMIPYTLICKKWNQIIRKNMNGHWKRIFERFQKFIPKYFKKGNIEQTWFDALIQQTCWDIRVHSAAEEIIKNPVRMQEYFSSILHFGYVFLTSIFIQKIVIRITKFDRRKNQYVYENNYPVIPNNAPIEKLIHIHVDENDERIPGKGDITLLYKLNKIFIFPMVSHIAN